MALYARNPGGSIANMLAMFAMLGGKTAFVGKVGKDAFGGFPGTASAVLPGGYQGAAADDRALTTLAIVTLMPDGERSFIFYRKPGADIMLTEDELPLDQIRNCRFFHIGGVTLTDEPVRSTTLAGARIAREAGAFISFDCNYRGSLWDGGEKEAREILPRALPLANLVKASEEELELLTGIQDQEQAARSILDLGCDAVLVSVFTPEILTYVPAYRVEAIDATGAGWTPSWGL